MQWPWHYHIYRVHRKLTERLIASGVECGVCEPMSDVVECTCCEEFEEAVAKLKDNEVNCITQHPGFNSVYALMSKFCKLLIMAIDKIMVTIMMKKFTSRLIYYLF